MALNLILAIIFTLYFIGCHYMKRSLYYILFVACLALVTACRSNPQSEFKVKISIAAVPNAKLILEELDINKVSLVDSSSTDSIGNGLLTGKYGKPNLYRLTVQDLGKLYLVIDHDDIAIELNKDDFYNYQITGSQRSLQIKDFVQHVLNYNKDVANTFVVPTSSSTDTAIVTTTSTKQENTLKALHTYIKQNADTVSSLPLALFYANFLPMEEEVSYLNNFLNKLPQRFPSEANSIKNYKDVFYSNYNLYVNEQKIIKDSVDQGLILNQTIKDFSAQDIDGTVINTAQYIGKYLVIQFVGSWNDNSRYWNKQLASSAGALTNYPVQLLSIYVESDKQAFTTAVENDSLAWPQLTTYESWNCPILKSFHIVTIPTTVILSPERKVIGVDWTLPQIVQELKTLSVPISNSMDTLTSTQQVAQR